MYYFAEMASITQVKLNELSDDGFKNIWNFTICAKPFVAKLIKTNAIK